MKRPPLRWHGGKWRIAPWIIDLMPPHHAYIEPFGGGGSVLMRKDRVQLEIYNDLDGSLVDFMLCVRDSPDELIRAVAATPFARTVFEGECPDDPLLKAVHFLCRSHMGHGSSGNGRATGFRAAGRRAGSLPVHNWADMPWVLRETAERLRGVVIENRPAARIIEDHDEASALFYLDPPYLPETRDTGADYRCEMTCSEHEALLNRILAVQGKVLISGYDSELYRDVLSDWRAETLETVGDRACKRTEVIWANFERNQQQIELFGALLND
ncbi:DNA adenine methylase [Sulfitobacter sp. G21635-S1]|uniref:DNA adenine methylase n=1 Tax=Sulfitobacter sp. G21635-S1 TaxID=3014043 RepID=UPI0022AFD2CD|nr:DNA adenine methylase [Sulfitobacter sp. G21635-S1]MCZ4258571.1 DNA adenine methylase [Sulfitobacter sp. G21635-S1]